MRGELLKRHIRAAAAMVGIYDDSALGEAVGVRRGAVTGWWRGAKPAMPTLGQIATVTGLSVDELSAFVYFGGPPPALPSVGSAAVSGVQEGIRRDQEHQRHEDRPGRAPLPERLPPDTEAGRRT